MRKGAYHPRFLIDPTATDVASAYRTAVVIPLAGDKPSIASIIERVARRHGVLARDVLAKNRQVAPSRARIAAMIEAVEHRPDLSLASIARIFKRDRSSIVAALRYRKN